MTEPLPIPLWLFLLLVPALLLLGGIGYRWWKLRRERQKRKLPKHWPLSVRALLNSEEIRIWHWLSRTFYDHHVMIKLPVTRFTFPRNPAEGKVWYQLLASVYCTFTICRTDGRVIGCVDVPPKQGIRTPVRRLKHGLLTQCGYPYWIVRSDDLPPVAEIRAEFLGESPEAQTIRQNEEEQRALLDAQANLRSAISRRRRNRGNTDFGGLSAWPNSTIGDGPPSDLQSQWGENSFLMPLDSRKGDLL